MIKIGSNEVTFPYSKIYLGSTLVWQNTPTPTPTYVNYIEGTGTQYVDTGVAPLSTYKAEIDFELTDTSVWGTIFGQNYASNYRDQCYRCDGKFAYNSGSSRARTATVNTPDTNRHTIVYNDSSKYYLDNTEVTAVGTNAKWHTSGLSAGNIFLFHFVDNSALTTSIGKGKIYGFKVTDTTYNTVVLDLKPALDNDNVPCFFDTVSNTFKYDCNGNTFLYG